MSISGLDKRPALVASARYQHGYRASLFLILVLTSETFVVHRPNHQGWRRQLELAGCRPLLCLSSLYESDVEKCKKSKMDQRQEGGLCRRQDQR